MCHPRTNIFKTILSLAKALTRFGNVNTIHTKLKCDVLLSTKTDNIKVSMLFGTNGE